MGVDTRLFISDRWDIADVRNLIAKRFDTKVVTNFHDFAPNYVTLSFTAKGVDRMLHVHTNYEMSGFKGTLLDFRANEHGIETLRTLAETLGGWFSEADTDDVFEAYRMPGSGNNEYLLKESIIESPEHGDNKEKLIDFLKDRI